MVRQRRGFTQCLPARISSSQVWGTTCGAPTIRRTSDGTIIFESPRRIPDTLRDISDVIPDAHLVIGRELTKLHEQIWRGSPGEALTEFAEPRGEFSILIIPPPGEPRRWTDAEIADALADALRARRVEVTGRALRRPAVRSSATRRLRPLAVRSGPLTFQTQTAPTLQIDKQTDIRPA